MGTKAAQSPEPLTATQPAALPENEARQQHLPLVESTPAPAQMPVPQPTKTNETASDALSAEKARVQSLISRIVSSAHASTAPAQSSKDVPAQPKPSAKQDTFEWTETSTAASLVYRVPADTRTANVSVKFDRDNLSLSVSPQDPKLAFSLARSLRRRIIVDSCWWALEDRSDGTRVLLVELEKAAPSMWGGVFEGEDQSAVERPDTPNNAISNENCDATNTDVTQSTGDDLARPAADDDSESMEQGVETFVESVIDTASAAAEDETKDTATQSANASPETEVEDVNDDSDMPGPTPSSASEPGGASAESDEISSSASLSPSEVQGRKVVTKADLPKLIAQHRAAVAARGPGWAEAAVQLGTLYHYGIGLEKRDDTEAARLYRLGLENGASDASAAFQLGLIYNQGDGANLRPDTEQAVKWWTVAAELGNAVAMFNLGVLCMNGSGCDMDPVAAMGWFQKARQLNPKLEIPQLTPAQLEQRVAMARRMRKERRWASMSEEERERRRTEAFAKLKVAMTATAGMAALVVGAAFVRNWWRNRL